MALGLERASLNKREQAAVRQELVDVHRHLYQSSFVLDSMKDMYNSTEPEADDTKRPMGVTFTKLKLPDDTLIFTPASFRDLPEASVAAIHQLRLPRASANVPPFPLARICDPCLSY